MLSYGHACYYNELHKKHFGSQKVIFSFGIMSQITGIGICVHIISQLFVQSVFAFQISLCLMYYFVVWLVWLYHINLKFILMVNRMYDHSLEAV